MKKLAILGAVAVLGIVILASASSADPQVVGVMYHWDGFDGILTVVNAEGRPIEVFDAYGKVYEGGVEANPFELPCPNAGPDEEGVILRV